MRRISVTSVNGTRNCSSTVFVHPSTTPTWFLSQPEYSGFGPHSEHTKYTYSFTLYDYVIITSEKKKGDGNGDGQNMDRGSVFFFVSFL